MVSTLYPHDTRPHDLTCIPPSSTCHAPHTQHTRAAASSARRRPPTNRCPRPHDRTARHLISLRPSVRVFVYYESLSLTVTSRAGSYASSSHLAFCRVFIFLVVRFSCVPIRGGTPPTFIAEDYCGLTDRPTEDGPRQVCGVTKFASGIGDRFLLCSLVR